MTKASKIYLYSGKSVWTFLYKKNKVNKKGNKVINRIIQEQ